MTDKKKIQSFVGDVDLDNIEINSSTADMIVSEIDADYILLDIDEYHKLMDGILENRVIFELRRKILESVAPIVGHCDVLLEMGEHLTDEKKLEILKSIRNDTQQIKVVIDDATPDSMKVGDFKHQYDRDDIDD